MFKAGLSGKSVSVYKALRATAIRTNKFYEKFGSEFFCWRRDTSTWEMFKRWKPIQPYYSAYLTFTPPMILLLFFFGKPPRGITIKLCWQSDVTSEDINRLVRSDC